jgi:hypothetical protein
MIDDMGLSNQEIMQFQAGTPDLKSACVVLVKTEWKLNDVVGKINSELNLQ